MRMMINTVALVGLFAGIPATVIAQNTDDPTAQGTANEELLTDSAPSAEAETPPEPVEGQIVLQSEDTVLAKDLIGTTVYSPGDEAVGDINDLIVKLDGSVDGVVIGVGGFLGIGEKQVAIELAKLDLVTGESGVQRLVLGATRDDLDAAPEFKSAADQRFEQEAEQMRNQHESGVPAPAAPSQ